MTYTLAMLLDGLFANGAALFWGGAAAVSIPVLIHLLTRLQRRPRAWGAMRFVIEAFRRHRTRLRLEQLILLLVRCLIVLILGLALAGLLMGGFARTLGLASDGRYVCIVIDDSLSTQTAASDTAKEPRFEQLRTSALNLVKSLGNSDRVGIWRGGSPAEAVVAVPTLDHGIVTRELEMLTPRYAHADLPGALSLVSATLKEAGVQRDRVFVVVLSDMAADAVPVDGSAPTELASLRQVSRVLISRPAAAASNVQIESLVPRRRMVLAAPATGALVVPVRVTLRRFVDTASQRDSAIDVDVLVGAETGSPQIIGSRKAQVAWQPGQAETTINLDIAIEAAAQADLAARAAARGDAITGSGVGGGHTVTVVAHLTDDDALEADNRRVATVEVRQRLLVGVVDDYDTPATSPDGVMAARRWVQLALSPRPGAGLGIAPPGGIEQVEAPIGLVDVRSTANWDAAVVLRPDLLTDDGWTALRAIADRGGLVWFFAPSQNAASQWSSLLPTRFDLEWTIGAEPMDNKPPAPADAAAAALDTTVAHWSLKSDTPTPEPLRLLSADWTELLAPVTIARRYDLSVREDAGDKGEVWLRLGDDGKNAPLLVAGRVGAGSVILLATAADPQWTNLPTKPLFVPLLHESIRGLLGEAGDDAAETKLVCGDQPVLGRRWDGVQQLVYRAIRDAAQPAAAPTSGVTSGGTSGGNLLLRRTNVGFEPVEPMSEPGLYTAAPQSNGRVLAVNIDQTDGDTRTIDERRLSDWLSVAMPEQDSWQWLDDDNPIRSLAAYASKANVGWPLLWIVLALVLAELVLARLFSHAHTGSTVAAAGTSGAAALLKQAMGRMPRAEKGDNA